MTSKAQEASALSALWQRIKRFLLGHSHRAAKPLAPQAQQRQIAKHRERARRHHAQMLERCYRRDSAIEATRKRLEHAWEDVST